MQYFNFEYIKGDERFKLGPHKALMRTLEDFYGAYGASCFQSYGNVQEPL